MSWSYREPSRLSARFHLKPDAPETGTPNRAHEGIGPSSKIDSIQGFERKRNSLTAADAQRDDTLFNTIAFHRMQQSSRQHRAGSADRVAVRDCTTFDVDDVRSQTEVLRDCNFQVILERSGPT